MVQAGAAVVAGHAVTLVHVGLAELASEARRAVAESLMVLGHAEASVLADARVAVHCGERSAKKSCAVKKMSLLSVS